MNLYELANTLFPAAPADTNLLAVLAGRVATSEAFRGYDEYGMESYDYALYARNSYEAHQVDLVREGIADYSVDAVVKPMAGDIVVALYMPTLRDVALAVDALNLASTDGDLDVFEASGAMLLRRTID